MNLSLKNFRLGASVRRLALLASVVAVSATSVTAQAQNVTRDELGPLVREYIMENPGIIIEAYERYQQLEEERQAQQAALTVKERGEEIYNSPTTPVMGNPDGDVAVVEFFDYNCGYCKRVANGMFAMVDSDPKLKFVLKELPILGPGSRVAAQASLAAKMQGKYDPFHREMIRFRGQISQQAVESVAKKLGMDVDKLKRDMNSDEVNQELAANSQLAAALGINGTPAFVVNDEVIPGAVPVEQIKAMVDAARLN